MNWGQIIWAIGGAWLVLYPAIALLRPKRQRSARITYRIGRAPGGAQ